METQTRDRVVGPLEARAIAQLVAHRENVACRDGRKLSRGEKDAIAAKVHADIEARRTAGPLDEAGVMAYLKAHRDGGRAGISVKHDD